jgi:segregation and condensation protein A
MSLERPPSSANPMPSALPSDTEGHAAYRVTLPEFEGPLDLLLHLCQTHELDILNISIAFIAEKYIEYLEVMTNMSVEVAADYLVMAAHLAYLKSRELVPSPEPLEVSEDGEDPIDPREELIRRLLQYQKYKNAAESLSNRPIEGRNVFVRGAILEPSGEAGLAEHSVWKLLEHWAQILEKAKPQYTHDVVVDRMSIADRINQIVDLLEANKGMVRFEELLGTDLPEAELRHKVVVSLLAVLELAKLHVVRILQQVETGSFFLAQTEGANLADARNLNVTSAREKEPTESNKANTAPMVEQAPVETSPASTPEESPTTEARSETTIGEEPVAEPSAAAADEPTSEEPAAAAADEPTSEEPIAAAADETLPVEEPIAAAADETLPVEEPTATAAAVDKPFPSDAPIAADAEALPVEEPAAAGAGVTTVEGLAAVASTDQPSPVEEPTAMADAASVAEVPAVHTEIETENTAGDTDQHVPQEDVISAPFPASAEGGEEVIDGQTHEEQKAPQE